MFACEKIGNETVTGYNHWAVTTPSVFRNPPAHHTTILLLKEFMHTPWWYFKISFCIPEGLVK